MHRSNHGVLGICRGAQLINVVLGGTLHQDVPSDLYGARTAEDVLRLPPAQQHHAANWVLMSATPGAPARGP